MSENKLNSKMVKDLRQVNTKTKKQEQENELLEKLAELEHQQWEEWSKALIGQLLGSPDEEAFEVHKKVLAKHQCWLKLWTPYEELSEEMKEQDRVHARRVLEVLGDLPQLFAERQHYFDKADYFKRRCAELEKALEEEQNAHEINGCLLRRRLQESRERVRRLERERATMQGECCRNCGERIVKCNDGEYRHIDFNEEGMFVCSDASVGCVAVPSVSNKQAREEEFERGRRELAKKALEFAQGRSEVEICKWLEKQSKNKGE